MTDEREKVTLYPLTLLIMMFTCMLTGVVLTWLVMAVNGTRTADCATFRGMEEKAHREVAQIQTGAEGTME